MPGLNWRIVDPCAGACLTSATTPSRRPADQLPLQARAARPAKAHARGTRPGRTFIQQVRQKSLIFREQSARRSCRPPAAWHFDWQRRIPPQPRAGSRRKPQRRRREPAMRMMFIPAARRDNLPVRPQHLHARAHGARDCSCPRITLASPGVRSAVQVIPRAPASAGGRAGRARRGLLDLCNQAAWTCATRDHGAVGRRGCSQLRNMDEDADYSLSEYSD